MNRFARIRAIAILSLLVACDPRERVLSYICPAPATAPASMPTHSAIANEGDEAQPGTHDAAPSKSDIELLQKLRTRRLALEQAEEAFAVRLREFEAREQKLTSKPSSDRSPSPLPGVIASMPVKAAARLLEGMDGGDASKLLQQLDAEKASALLGSMDSGKAAKISTQLMRAHEEAHHAHTR